MECRGDTAASEISDDGVALGADKTTETGPEGGIHTGRTPTPHEGQGCPEGGDDPTPTFGSEEEGVVRNSCRVAGEEPPRVDSPGGGLEATGASGAAVGLEQVEDTDAVPVSTVDVAAESDGLRAAGGDEHWRSRGGGSDSGENGDGDNGDDAFNREVEGDVTSCGASSGGVGDKLGPSSAREPETIDQDDIAGGGVGGAVAEDFFAGDGSSGEDELYPGAAAATGVRIAPTEDFTGSSDQDPEGLAHDQPPSPRIIASSIQTDNHAGAGGGFGYPPRSPVSTQRKEASATAGEGGLSEAAKAAVAAALANASSAAAPSRREGDGSKSRKKKKSSHKERRRKRSGSKSGGEEDSGAGERGSGTIGRAEGGGTGREKRSSSRRHRKPTV